MSITQRETDIMKSNSKQRMLDLANDWTLGLMKGRLPQQPAEGQEQVPTAAPTESAVSPAAQQPVPQPQALSPQAPQAPPVPQEDTEI